jgi:hypothetical protein
VLDVTRFTTTTSRRAPMVGELITKVVYPGVIAPLGG